MVRDPGRAVVADQPTTLTDSAPSAGVPAAASRLIALLVILSVLSTAFVTLAPAFVGAFTDVLGFTPELAGLTVSAQLAGSGLGVMIVLLGWRDAPPPVAVMAAVAAMAACDLGSAFVTSAHALIGLRAIAGVPAGIALAAVNAAVARTPGATRLFAVVTGAQMLFGAVGYLAWPLLLRNLGLGGTFAALGACALAILPLAPSYPAVKTVGAQPTAGAVTTGLSGGLLLGSLLTEYVANSAIWTYLDRIGIDANLASDTVAFALAASMGGGLAGSFAAMVLQSAARIRRALIAGLALLALGSALLLWSAHAPVYVGVVVVFTGAMMFVLPLYLSWLSTLPGGQRLAVIAGFLIYAGLALGPLVGSQVVAFAGYRPLIVGAALAFVAATGLAALARPLAATPTPNH